MSPYRVKYKESEYDIQHINLLYKIHQQCQNTFDILKKIKKGNQTFQMFILYYV